MVQYDEYGNFVYHLLPAYFDLLFVKWLPYLDNKSTNHLQITIMSRISLFLLTTILSKQLFLKKC